MKKAAKVVSGSVKAKTVHAKKGRLYTYQYYQRSDNMKEAKQEKVAVPLPCRASCIWQTSQVLTLEILVVLYYSSQNATGDIMSHTGKRKKKDDLRENRYTNSWICNACGFIMSQKSFKFENNESDNLFLVWMVWKYHKYQNGVGRQNMHVHTRMPKKLV